jgi:hypothetical protein
MSGALQPSRRRGAFTTLWGPGFPLGLCRRREFRGTVDSRASGVVAFALHAPRNRRSVRRPARYRFAAGSLLRQTGAPASSVATRRRRMRAPGSGPPVPWGLVFRPSWGEPIWEGRRVRRRLASFGPLSLNVQRATIMRLAK